MNYVDLKVVFQLFPLVKGIMKNIFIDNKISQPLGPEDAASSFDLQFNKERSS